MLAITNKVSKCTKFVNITRISCFCVCVLLLLLLLLRPCLLFDVRSSTCLVCRNRRLFQTHSSFVYTVYIVACGACCQAMVAGVQTSSGCCVFFCSFSLLSLFGASLFFVLRLLVRWCLCAVSSKPHTWCRCVCWPVRVCIFVRVFVFVVVGPVVVRDRGGFLALPTTPLLDSVAESS